MLWTIVGFLFVCYLLKKFVLEKLVVGDLSSKHVFITGCDTGFGHMLALKLIENGIPTFAACYSEKGRKELEQKGKFSSGKLYTLLCDVTDDASVAKAAEFVGKELKGKGLWGVVCNAGVASANAPDDWLDINDYKKVMEVNGFGVVRTCHAFKPFVKKERGRIVIIASILGRVGIPAVGPYAMSKFAVEGYADCLRLEMDIFGVSVHILEPGFFKTTITDPVVIGKAYDSLWNRLPEETKKEYGRQYYEGGKEMINKTLRRYVNDKTHLVVDAYYHALTSKFPRLRYHLGIDAQLFFIPITCFLTRFQDFALKMLQKLENAPVPSSMQK